MAFFCCQRWVASFSELCRTVLNSKLDRGSRQLVTSFSQVSEECFEVVQIFPHTQPSTETIECAVEVAKRVPGVRPTVDRAEEADRRTSSNPLCLFVIF